MEFISNSYEETREAGKNFSKILKSGDNILLVGDLGAGKTAFTSGICEGLDISDYVSSPTFTIVNEYLSGKIPVYHFDLYRLCHEDDLYDIGIDEYFDNNGICVFEWPELVHKFTDNFYRVEILKDLSISEDYRKIIITKTGN